MLASRSLNGIRPVQFRINCFSCYEVSATDCRRGLKQKQTDLRVFIGKLVAEYCLCSNTCFLLVPSFTYLYVSIDADEGMKVGDSSSLISELVLESTKVEIPLKFVRV
jgi:hypothetical protein